MSGEETVNSVLKRMSRRVRSSAFRIPGLRQSLRLRRKEGPVVVFHHIPRCGGTSLLYLLDSWYTLITDYRKGWSNRYPRPVDLELLGGQHCLAGHFETTGNHLIERYPEVFQSERFFPITMVRAPLAVRMSLWRFERAHGLAGEETFDEHLLDRPNYIATILQASETNFREVLDRYRFVGILEAAEDSVHRLGSLLHKPPGSLPILNSTSSMDERADESLSRRFRQTHELDYAIYEYAVGRLGKEAPSLEAGWERPT